MSVSLNDIIFALQNHGDDFIFTPWVLDLDLDADGFKLEEIAQACDAFHLESGCPCGRSIDPRALWKVDILFEQDTMTGLEDFDPATSTARLLDPAASVESVFGGGNFVVSTPAINLMIGLEPGGPGRLSSMCFKVLIVLTHVECSRSQASDAYEEMPAVYQDSMSENTFLHCPCTAHSSNTRVAFSSTGRTPEYVERLLGSYSVARIPIIRRGAGYGKTAFVSLIAAWFRASGSWDMFPRRRTGFIPEPHYLTLVVDFADLAPQLPEGQSGTHAEIMVACKTFVAETIERFSETNADILGTRRPSRNDAWMHTYKGLRTLILQLRTRLVVAFDNYTAPFEHVSGMRAQDTEFEIWAQILGPVIHDFDSVVWRGFITGRPLGDILPFTSRPIFVERTRDITDDPEFLGMIGFTYDDVLHLGNAAYGNSYDLPAVMKLAKDQERDVYSARQVTTALSQILDDPDQSATVPASRSIVDEGPIRRASP